MHSKEKESTGIAFACRSVATNGRGWDAATSSPGSIIGQVAIEESEEDFDGGEPHNSSNNERHGSDCRESGCQPSGQESHLGGSENSKDDQNQTEKPRYLEHEMEDDP
jgi:hypothetical protein